MFEWKGKQLWNRKVLEWKNIDGLFPTRLLAAGNHGSIKVERQVGFAVTRAGI